VFCDGITLARHRFSESSCGRAGGETLAHRCISVLIRLTKKLAEMLNGVDLRAFAVGQLIDSPDPVARMLIAEQWAEEVTPFDVCAVAADRSRPRSPKGTEGKLRK
jgi:hypothetical protein